MWNIQVKIHHSLNRLKKVTFFSAYINNFSFTLPVLFHFRVVNSRDTWEEISNVKYSGKNFSWTLFLRIKFYLKQKANNNLSLYIKINKQRPKSNHKKYRFALHIQIITPGEHVILYVVCVLVCACSLWFICGWITINNLEGYQVVWKK